MKDNWRRVELGTVADLLNGDRGKNYPSAKVRVSSGIPFINAGHLDGGRVRMSGMDFITPEHFARLRGGKVEQGDVLLCIRGSLGRTALITSDVSPAAIASSLVIVRPHPTLISRYLLAFFESPIGAQQVISSDNGSAQPNIGARDVSRFLLPFPPLEIQRKIAAVLSAYDDLIENNNRRIALLEEMARTIYREWFVEFRYAGREDALLLESDLGRIPEGWAIVRIDDVAEIVRGRSYSKSEIVGAGGVPFLNLKCINRGGGFRKSGLKRYTGPYKSAQEVRPTEIVIAVTDMTQERNVVARAARVPSLPDDFGVISLDLVKVVPTAVRSTFLYGLLRYSSFPHEVKNFANGANVLHLHPDRIGEYRFVCAPPSLQLRYSEIVDPMYDLIDRLESQVENLRITRDLLVPRLVSGDIDLSKLDLDGVVESV